VKQIVVPEEQTRLARGVSTTTSCPACLYDSFSADSQYALTLDPIDHSPDADHGTV
jgi:hypothetical protein